MRIISLAALIALGSALPCAAQTFPEISDKVREQIKDKAKPKTIDPRITDVVTKKQREQIIASLKQDVPAETYVAFHQRRNGSVEEYNFEYAFHLAGIAQRLDPVRVRSATGDPRRTVNLFQEEDGSVALVHVDSNNRMMGITRMKDGSSAHYFDFEGDRSIDVMIFEGLGETLFIIAQDELTEHGMEAFDVFCRMETGSERLSGNDLQAAMPVSCVANGVGAEGGKPGGILGLGGTLGGKDGVAEFFRANCETSTAQNQAGGMVAGPGGALGWIFGRVKKGIGGAIANFFFDIANDGRGGGSFTDPHHTGSYACEYAGGPACGSDEDYLLGPGERPEPSNTDSPEPDAPANPDDVPAPEPADDDTDGNDATDPIPGEEGDGMAGLCASFEKQLRVRFALSGKDRAVTTDCFDHTGNPGKSMSEGFPDPVHLSCFGGGGGEPNDPMERLDNLLAGLRDDCWNPAAQTKPDGQCRGSSNFRSQGTVWFSYSDVIAAQVGIETCPPEICSGRER